MALYAGIDCGTQSTKVIIVNSQKTHILGEGMTILIADNSPSERLKVTGIQKSLMWKRLPCSRDKTGKNDQ
ncbi:hypothetical protein [Photorhabdus sp. CRCIA-P01]|uniref:hypothetical protein n=1 Tax=Photorhabdus sp. CRCIA-P01 TaxID=2019570 RepID=UPI000E59A284|nr:hypothetical protein [Photorhabdus sp. CRCIA-P01]